jgi:hypothetical protein
MRLYRSWALFAVFALFAVELVSPRTSRASDLLIGQLSFDDVGTGDAFDLNNFTDGLQSPDGIADNDLFSGSLTVDIQGVGDEVFNYSGIDSLLTGAVSPTIVVLPYSDEIISATLTLSLSKTTGVNIFNDSGSPAVANLLGVPSTSLPPLVAGQDLTACDANGDPCSQANIYVNTAPPPPPPGVTPEPESLWLVATGVCGAISLVRRRRWQRV